MKHNIRIALFAVLFGFMASASGFMTPEAALVATGLMAGAVVSVKSTVITNLEAIPNVLNKAFLARGRVHAGRGVCTAANGDSIASTYRFGRVKSSDLVKQIMLDNASWGAACTADFGLYQTAENGGAVVDADLFASAVDMNTANRALDITRESGVITVANMEKRVWELLGLTTDPNREYEITATLVAAAAAAGAACVSFETVPSAG